MTPENSLQVCCVDWFRYQYPSKIIFSVPNGAVLGGRNKYALMNMLKRTGLLPGMLDLCIPEPVAQRDRNNWPVIKHGLFVELKTGKNEVSEKQQLVIDALRLRGYEVHVCYTLEEFQEVVRGYFRGSDDKSS